MSQSIKKLLTIFSCLGLSISQPTNVLYAQISSYSFSSSVGVYNELLIANNLGDSTTEDQFFVDPSNQNGDTTRMGQGLPIGFTFDYNGFGMNVFGISANGWIALGNSSINMNSASLFFPLNSSSGGNFLAACARNLQAQSGSNLSYFTNGNSPSRVLTIEWRNYRKHSNFGDTFNFQIQLHEIDNSIEFHYGNFAHNINASFASVGMIGQDSSDFSVRSTVGSGGWNNTSTGTLNSATCTLNPSTLPQSGLIFRWFPPLPCSAPPLAGISASSVSSVCPNTPFSLSLVGNSTGPGQSYQWQSSSDTVLWQIISGAQTTSLYTTQTQSLWYRCEVTCSGQSSYSFPVMVAYNPPNLCYCTQNLGGQCSSYGYIDSVSIALTTLHNYNTGCAALTDIYYSDYPVDSNTTADLLAGSGYAISVTCSFTASISLWVDFDQSGTFDVNEWTQVSASSTTNIPNTVLFSVPSTAVTGLTKMRLRSRSAGSANAAIDACTNFLSGETEDYTITISQPVNTSFKDIENETFSVFPNPGNGTFHVKFKSAKNEGQLTIYSFDGKFIKTIQVNKKSGEEIILDLGGLTNGIYFIRYINNYGSTIKRIMKTD